MLYKNVNLFLSRLRASSIITDSFWSLTGNVFGKGLALFAGILVARFLGKDVYGEFGILRNTIFTIGVFSTFGLGYTATKYIADFQNNNPSKIRSVINNANIITLGFSVSMAVLLFCFANFISRHWLEAPHLNTPLRIFSVLVIFNAITTTQIGILSGFKKFKQIARINIIIGVITFILSIAFTYLYSLIGALIALLIAQIINCILNYRIVQNAVGNLESEKASDYNLLKEMIRFSTPIALQEFLYCFSSWIFMYLLMKFSTYGEVGLYSVAMQWSGVILFIPGVLRNVTLAYLSGTINQVNNHNKVFNIMIVVSIIATLFPTVIVYIFSDYIVNFYGESFKDLNAVLNISVFTTLFHAMANIYAQEYTAKNMNWIMLIIVTFKSFVIVGLYIYLENNFNQSSATLLSLSILIAMILTVASLHIIYKLKKN